MPASALASRWAGLEAMDEERRSCVLCFGRVTKRRFCLVQAIQACEVQVAAIHHVGGSRLKAEFVKAPHVTHPPSGEVNEARDIAAQIEECVQFECRLRLAKVRPREQRQTQINGARIEGVGAAGQLDTEGLIDVERTCLINQTLRELGKDAPVAPLVGVSKRGALNRL